MKVKAVDFYRLAQPIDHDDKAHADYLRYDRGFVFADDLTLVAFPKLAGPQGKGVYAPGPTFDRWPRSFGLKLGEHLRTDSEIHAAWERTGDWTTYRHPRLGTGPEDYTRLVPVTLAEVLTVSDLDATAVVWRCVNCQKPTRASYPRVGVPEWLHDDGVRSSWCLPSCQGPRAAPIIGAL